jgi:hypothetical protein
MLFFINGTVNLKVICLFKFILQTIENKLFFVQNTVILLKLEFSNI